MANFETVPGDKNVMFDKGVGRLIVPLGGSARMKLWGGSNQNNALEVDVNAPDIASVTLESSNMSTWTFIYRIEGANKGNAMLEARDFGGLCPTAAYKRAQWLSKPVYASIQLTVVPEFLQGQAPWGQKTYKSVNPMWRDVHWTNMALAGCGPTSLAIIMDYITTWDKRYPRPQNACIAPNVTPSTTMDYASRYGRAADGSKKPSGTDGVTMMKNIGVWWPGYQSQALPTGHNGVDQAADYLKAGEVLIFLLKNADTYKYDKKGNLAQHHWDGHFMVLVGVDSTASGAKQIFFIADPSKAQTQFVSRKTLENSCQIWRVTLDPLFVTANMSVQPNASFNP
ncbi:MAG TPA: hypothetical protein VHZ07_05845 [Bryobacteraceae bacterium]|nr:hypothetical protein [Bryobacteraceae bacterium]